MVKRETVFSRHINSRLSGSIWCEKTNNSFRAGMPDFYYESSGGILWVEYKWREKPFKDSVLAQNICTSNQWGLQRLWLERAHLNGIKTAVIVGVGIHPKAYGYILEYPYCFHKDQDELNTIDQIRDWITNNVT